MYNALYRKYRPHVLNDVVGQDVIIKTLKNSIINNKINHAYLFTGPRGCGKTSIAKIFAEIINCFDQKNGEICQKCVFCTQKSNIDIIEIDAASNNGVDDIREINNKVNLVPALGKYKVYIIDEVHMLTIGAFNALLKTLEEPPSHVIFILATTDPHKLPTTIISRCQRFDFKRISDENITERLTYIASNEQFSIDQDAILEIARLSDGGMRDAISILEQVAAYADNNITIKDVHDINGSVPQFEIKELINGLITNDITLILKEIDSYSKKGKNMVKILEEVIQFLRNLLILKTAPLYFQENINLSIYNDLSEKISIDNILSFLSEMNSVLLEMRRNSNPKMLLELLFIKISNINLIPQKPTDNQEKANELSIDNQKKVDKSQSKVKQESINFPYNTRKNISQEINLVSDINFELERFKQIRINNTLCEFSKKKTSNFKKDLTGLNDYLLNDKYNQIATIILDGELKAANDNHLIFVYKTKNSSNIFNENIPKIEKLLIKIFNIPIKVISSYIDEWEEIKNNFNNNKDTFKYQEETISIDTILSQLKKNNNEDDIKNLFGDLVEYN